MKYRLVINSVSYKKEAVKQLLIQELHCSEKQAFKYVSVSPIEVANYNTLEEAEQLKNKLEELGVYVEIQGGDTGSETENRVITKNHTSKAIEEDSSFSVGNFLKILGVIIWIIGCIGGLLNMSTIGVVMGLSLLFSSIIIGALIFGLGEIINTLYNIEDKLK